MDDMNSGVYVVVFLLIILGLVGIVAYNASYASSGDTYVTCKVNDKDRGGDRNSQNSHYRIYTDNCGVLINEDSFFKGKHNSADVFNQIVVGKTYKFHIYGWRNQWFSDFPNILTAEEVKNGN